MTDDITELVKVRAAFEELRGARWWVDHGRAGPDHEALRECVRHLRSDCTTPEMGARVLALCDAIQRLQAERDRLRARLKLEKRDRAKDADHLLGRVLTLREALERIEARAHPVTDASKHDLGEMARRALAGDDHD